MIRTARRSRGLTQRELAEKLDTTQSAVARLERRGGTTTVLTLERVMAALGKDLVIEAADHTAQVDETLIAANLRMSPVERLATSPATTSIFGDSAGWLGVADPRDELPAIWPEFDLREMLSRLTAGGVDFVIIGGIAVVLLGSARTTRDLDIVVAPDRGDLEALGEVLIDLGASLRGIEGDLPFVPDAATLDRVSLLTLSTSAGWLDVHRRPDGAPPYGRLRQNAERIDLGDMAVLVASVDDMIAMKRAAGRLRDQADIAELEAIRRIRDLGAEPRTGLE